MFLIYIDWRYYYLAAGTLHLLQHLLSGAGERLDKIHSVIWQSLADPNLYDARPPMQLQISPLLRSTPFYQKQRTSSFSSPRDREIMASFYRIGVVHLCTTKPFYGAFL